MAIAPPGPRARRKARRDGNTSPAALVMQKRAAAAHGQGGGKSGSSNRAPREAPNTLRSKTMGRFIDVLSEGPIQGLVNGAQSIYLNDTPLQNADGSYNFQGINLSLMAGTPDQGARPGFNYSAREVGVGVQVPEPEWGAMIREGSEYVISGEWWVALLPGTALVILVIALSMLGDGLSDLLDPRRPGRSR